MDSGETLKLALTELLSEIKHQARMVRENNQKILNQQPQVKDDSFSYMNNPEVTKCFCYWTLNSQDDDPKFGAGSVFGKDVKEEARRKKLGITRKVCK